MAARPRPMERGGWPALVTGQAPDAPTFLESYLEAISRSELLDAGSQPNPVRMTALLRALSRNIATEISQARLAEEANIGANQIRSYLDALERTFVLEPQPAWSPKLRSAVRKRVKSKWHFVDPSIAVSALGASPSKLLNDLETMGFMFESLCVRDLRVYASPERGTVFHYRDETGLEVDAVVELPDGTWSAFEVKLGGADAIDKAAASLRALSTKVDDQTQARLGTLNVLTAGNVSYPRSDGVNVVSLGHLGP